MFKDVNVSKFWFIYYRVANWWHVDVWGWIRDIPVAPPEPGHCIGRRTGKPVPCPNCDDPRPY